MNDPVLEALNRAAEEISPEDIDRIIVHLRKTRQNYESGVKVKAKKEGEVSSKEMIDKMKIKPKLPEGFVRRV